MIHAGTDSYHGNPPGAAPAPAPRAGAPRQMDGGSPLWPEYNKMINGYFKWHWNYPTQIAVKIDDPASPINAAFGGVNPQTGARTPPRGFSIVDEVYTFNETSYVRSRAHILTSIDYAKMPAEVKAQEPAPQRTDHDYALSYLVKEGQGRVFVEVLGHDESIYKQTPMLAHILAGMQYALGDLQADDSPSAARRAGVGAEVGPPATRPAPQAAPDGPLLARRCGRHGQVAEVRDRAAVDPQRDLPPAAARRSSRRSRSASAAPGRARTAWPARRCTSIRTFVHSPGTRST